MLAFNVSGMILYPLVGMVFGSFWATLLAFIFLPVYAYSKIINKVEPVASETGAAPNPQASDRTKRFQLLTFAVAEGVLTGFLFSSHYLSSIEPFAFFSPLLVGIGAQFAIPQQANASDRLPTLGICVGSGLVAHFVVGLFTGQLAFPYLLLTLLHTAIALCSLQIYFKYHEEDEKVI